MIILASASPRRKELLEQLGCEFTIEVSAAEEVMAGAMTPAQMAEENARRKAMAVAAQHPQSAVLGADTIVVLDGKVYGKPADADEACAFLRRLSGQRHQVITGIALCTDGQMLSRAVSTEVRFAELSEEEIRAYVATGEPLDKAGAYAIQGRAAAFIEGIDGSFSNVVGLPLRAVVELAKEAGVTLYAGA